MKKLAPTNLILLLAVKFVGACELPKETIPVVLERLFYDNIFYYSSLVLIFAALIFCILRKGKVAKMLAVTVSSSLLYIVLTFFGYLSDSCGDACPTDICGDSSSKIIKIGFAFFLMLFLYQAIFWVSYRKTLKMKLR